MWKLTGLLCLLWTATILYGELFSYLLPSLGPCSWPRLSMNNIGSANDYVNVAVIADPQLTDRTSLPLSPKSIALEIVQFYSDLSMRRAFLLSIMPLKPDVVLFLGDNFDGGPILSDEEWQESLSRFKHIFDINSQEGDAAIPVYYLAGNHDIGYASFYSRKPEVISRHEKEFGARNDRFMVGKVEFIAVDSQNLDGKRGNPGDLASISWNFVKNVSGDIQLHPRVLLTHIPLYRPDWTYCGPFRSSPIINQRISHTPSGQEIMYQNYVTKESSNHLLDLLKPVLILSGHDHDQCTVNHESKYGAVKEHTLGTISWQQGNLYPSFMLLSASNFVLPNISSPEEAISTQLCFLPMQTHIYIWYLLQFVVTVTTLLLWPTSGVKLFPHICNLVGYTRQLLSIFGSGTKEKNEDENCEYDMIWDAEGSMHLIKKVSNVPPPRPKERVESCGKAVMRPTAKRQTQDTEVALNVNMNEDSVHDATAKLLPRTSKSKTTIVIQRLVRTFRGLSVIAAVNVPLYMMLLFKDWNDK